ncbi:Os01g0909300 [Oryza sativa Japonica Group]|uniref:Os01g0909300 protein n=1 Tax=Oryza sativa subsp. japonica TaxID=39947 RepID=Q0JGR5_ORYSJ|nr:Os01g0909300 [Oryza sativa Japonica Group]|eukprot:NP_001045149.2 Os01g0909300 [Oryza sativa Japonica Group]
MEVEGAPDLADFMNDWFFGTVGTRRSGGGAYDLTGDQSSGKRPSAPAEKKQQQQQGRSGGGGGGSASKQTQEWLEEARRMVGAGSPGRKGVGSPSRQVPRFAAAAAAGTEPSPSLDRRDPMSRSARRHRQPGGIGDEILQRASISSSPPRADPFASAPASPAHSLPPNPPSSRRKSRFHYPSAPDAFSSSSAYRRAASSASTSPTSAAKPHHRRHASASSSSSPAAVDVFDDGVARLNSFLRRQRAAVAELGSGGRPSSRSTKIVLSDASKSVSSIAAAICYAWMLASKEDAEAAVPVVNMRRGRMERCRQAAWLLHHVGVDASALLFADEVDMEGLMMDKRVSLVVVGQDVLKPNDKMGSVCTILTNNYCEDAYSLLQSLDIKKLLLAGILLDTKNLSNMCSNRDSEAVQLLLFVLLDHNDHSFVEYLKNNYREPSTKGEGNSPLDQKHSVSASGSSQDAKKPNSNNQRPVHGNGGKTSDETPRGKNKYFLAKWGLHPNLLFLYLRIGEETRVKVNE